MHILAFLHVLTYSCIFCNFPAYSCIIFHIPAYSCILLRILAFLHIPTYSCILMHKLAYSHIWRLLVARGGPRRPLPFWRLLAEGRSVEATTGKVCNAYICIFLPSYLFSHTPAHFFIFLHISSYSSIFLHIPAYYVLPTYSYILLHTPR